MYMHVCIYVYIYIYNLELLIPQTQRHKIQTLASHRLNSFSMEGGGGGGGGGGMFIDCPEQMTEKDIRVQQPHSMQNAHLLLLLHTP